MRRMQRIVLLIGLIALAPVLAGCENFDMDKLDVFGLSEKKKLPGDRKPLFPEGVPGVSQGIPPEFVKGNQPPPESPQVLPAEPAKKTVAVDPVEEPKPKPKPKRKKPKATAAAPEQAAPQSQQQAPQQAPAPWPSAPAPGTFSR